MRTEIHSRIDIDTVVNNTFARGSETRERKMAKYLSCAETAKLVRQALKECFPGVKFSVKSSVYSMGASISVRWQDGPNGAQVESVTSRFEGSYFDGMIDYKGSKYHKLDGEEVRFGADSIRCSRDESNALIDRAIAMTSAKYSAPVVSADEFRSGNAWRLMDGNYVRLVNAARSKISDRLKVAPSATLERVDAAGDDGYGAGTVGRDGEGGNQCYVAISRHQERQQAEAVLAQMAVVGGVQ